MNKKRYTQKEMNHVREVAIKMLAVKDNEIKAFKKDNYDLNCKISKLERINQDLDISLKRQRKTREIESNSANEITKIYDDAFAKVFKQLKKKDNIILTLAIINIILFGLLIKGLL